MSFHFRLERTQGFAPGAFQFGPIVFRPLRRPPRPSSKPNFRPGKGKVARQRPMAVIRVAVICRLKSGFNPASGPYRRFETR
jgi:hypothetical protein